MSRREALEAQLDDFDPQRRQEAFHGLLEMVAKGSITLPEPGQAFNLHCHSFFSFNGYGYSPTKLAWLGRCKGLCAMGLVDFDVLDGIDEFLSACKSLGLRACAGFETRVYVAPFADRQINSPGEPGIAYHMGTGFTSSWATNPQQLDAFKETANLRTKALAERVGAYLAELDLDFARDIQPLTPAGNATERHVCVALEQKARAVFPEAEARVAYFADKLGVDAPQVRAVLDDPPAMQGLIRKKTMKKGGVGYVQPAGPDFPTLADVSRFARDNGALPTFTFLDGTSAGEAAMDELLDAMQATGVAAANIIPDRNWNIADAATRDEKVARLHAFVSTAEARGLPILIGTEMNAYGQRFVDDFDAEALQPLLPAFSRGMHILHAHTRLHAHAGMGYLGSWAKQQFADDVHKKNAFFHRAGELLHPGFDVPLAEVNPASTPEQVLSLLNA
ncbi:MAG: hypothetical protein ACLFTT_10705 [Candidatus Hydrogenedentota bacterium]